MVENFLVKPENLEREIAESSVFVVYPIGLEIMSVVVFSKSCDVMVRYKEQVFSGFSTAKVDELLLDESANRELYANMIAGGIWRRLHEARIVDYPYRAPYVCFPYPPTGDFFSDDREWKLIEARFSEEVDSEKLAKMKQLFGGEESRVFARLD